MESLWSSFLVVAGVFVAFSGTASVWGRWQRRKRARQLAAWQALMQPSCESSVIATHPTAPPASLQSDIGPSGARGLPPDPSFADCPSFVSDSDSRRAALDEALDRMSRQTPSDASNSADWEDTEPSVAISNVLPHGVGQRSPARGPEAA